MQRQASGDAWFGLKIRLMRANPAVYREIYIPDFLRGEDIAKVTFLSVGLEPENFNILGTEGEYIPYRDVSAGELLSEREELIVERPACYSFFVRVTGSCTLKQLEEKADRPALQEGLPFVMTAVGNNVPEKNMLTGTFNRIQKLLEEYDYCEIGPGEYLSGKELSFYPAKTDNAIRKLYSPETAVREINKSYTMPGMQLLEKLKVNELRQIAEWHGVFYYGSSRKAGLVEDIAYKFLREESIKGLFQDMSVSEYSALKRFALTDDPEETGEDWENTLSFLYSRGLFSYISKAGWRIASEILEYYDSIRDTEEEKQLIREKYMHQAMIVSARYYGVFRREQYEAILDKVAPEKIEKAVSDEYYGKVLIGDPEYSAMAIGRTKSGAAYSKRELYEKDAEQLIKEKEEGESWYIPLSDEIDEVSKHWLSFSDSSEKVLDLIPGMHIRVYSQYGETIHDKMLSALRKRGDVESAIETVRKEFSRSYWYGNYDGELKQIEEIIKREVRKLPIMALNGHSFKNCPKDILSRFEKTESKGGENSAGAGRAKAKKTAVKAEAVKRRY